MSTLAVRFEASLAGSDLSVRVDAQAAQLQSFGDAIARLSRGDLPALGDLERMIGSLPAPDISVPGDFAINMDALRAAVPGDFSSIVEPLIVHVQTIGASLSGFVGPLSNAVAALEAIAQLTTIDLSCGVPRSNGARASASATAAATAGASASAAPSAAPPTAAPAPPPAAPAAAPPVSAGIAQIDQALDRVPVPHNVAAVLGLLNQMMARRQFEHIIARPVPYIHEFRDTLSTLVRWRAASGADIAADMAATLDGAATHIRVATSERVAAVVAEINALSAAIDTNVLGNAADTLTARLNELRAALAAADAVATAAVVQATQSALTDYEVARDALVAFQLEARVQSLRARFAILPDELEDELTHALSALRPDGALGELDVFRPPPPDARPNDDTFRVIETKLGEIAVWLQDVLRKVDLAPFVVEVARVDAAIDQTAAALDERLVAATVEVRALFGRLEAQLAAIDTAALSASVEAATREFAASLSARLSELLEAVRTAVANGLAAIGEQADQFDPEDVIGALRQAIESLAGVLQDPAVRQVADQVRGAIETAEQQLAAVSFAPVADEVIRAIEAIGTELDKIDESQLNGALRAALDTALSVLPPSIQPVTSGLTVELSGVIESGPVPALQAVQERMRASLDQVRRFEPAALLGDALAQPYRDLLGELDAFTPTRALDPARDRLASFRQRIAAQANPGRVIAPLEQPFEGMLTAFDRLDPAALVRPIEEALARVADTALAPVFAALDTVLGPVEAVVARVRSLTDIVARVNALIRKLQDVLTGLVDAEAQTRSWVDSILDRVSALPNTLVVQAAFDRMETAFAAAAAGRLEASLDGAVRPLLTRLESLNAGTRLGALVQARRRIEGPAVEAIADGSLRASAQSLLGRIDPLVPSFGAHLRALADLQSSLASAPVTLHAGLDGWDARYLGPLGAASCLRRLDPTPAGLRASLATELEVRFTRPLVAVFVRVETLQKLLVPLLAILESVATAFDDALAALLAAPEALLRVRERLDALATRVRGLGGAVLRDQLGGIFAELRAKLDTVSPARLRAIVEEQFNAVLSTIDIDAALPDLAILDVEYEKLIAKIRALDPQQLVIDIVQPEFEATLQPLIASFDITAVIDLLIRRLQGLDEELNAELARVDEAYQSLLRSAPGGGISASLAVSVEV